MPVFLKLFIRNKFSFIFDFKFKYEVKKIRNFQIHIVNKIRKKEKIKVIFLVIHDSIWKYEEIYNFLDKDPKFKVSVVIIPLVRGKECQMCVFNKTLNYFVSNGYNTVSSYDENNSSWFDIKSIINPDVVFFTNPHRLTFDKYYIDNFTDKLTCYVPYAFVVIHSIAMHYNQKFHQVLWKYFVETKYHSDFSSLFTQYNNDNIVITGFPGLDKKYTVNYKPKKVWKNYLDGSAIKIIWAPHHTIPGQGSGLDYSSFIEYANFFIGVLKIRSNLQIAFKPHPLLKEKLYADGSWGVEKTDNYYNQWNNMPNGQLEDGNYIDLFELSDAMIMDSASFIIEYLYFDKPILFTMRDKSILDRFNYFGKMAFDYIYKSTNRIETSAFISNIVIGENDNLRESRNKFLQNEILPKNGKTASENIYNELKHELC